MTEKARATKRCVERTRRINTGNKLVQGVWRPWYWGTKYARDQDIKEDEIKLWCKEAGVVYKMGEDVVETMHRIDLATKMSKELAYPNKNSLLEEWKSLIRRILRL